MPFDLAPLVNYRNIPLENIPAVVTALMKTGNLFASNHMYVLRDIIWNLLKRVPMREQFSVLSAAISNGDANLLAIELIIRVEDSHHRFGYTGFVPESEKLLNEEDIPALEKIALLKIDSILQTDGNFNNRDILTVLHVWIDLENKKAKDWINKKLKSSDNLIDFVDRFLSSRLYDPRSNEPRYELDKSILTFVDLAKITQRVSQEIQLPNVEPSVKKKLSEFLLLAGKLDTNVT